jgi:hydrogenase maturation protease
MVKNRRILIAGVGNELRRDDGFGPAVIRELFNTANAELFGADILDFGQRLYDLLLKLKEYDVAIIVDAIEGEGKPGDVYVIHPEDIWKARTKSLNLHDADLKELIALGDKMGSLPEKVYVVGCHPEDVSWGVGLTPVVAEKIAAVIELIYKIIKNSD